jgi:hypothetical protein
MEDTDYKAESRNIRGFILCVSIFSSFIFHSGFFNIGFIAQVSEFCSYSLTQLHVM